MNTARFAVATLFAVVAIITADLTVISLQHSELWVSYMFGFMSLSSCVASWVYPWIIKEAHDA